VAPAATNPVTYRSATGPGCPKPAGGGYKETGRYSDGKEGWYNLSSGGSTANGCDGSFVAVPMSGAADKDNDARVTWQWSVGAASTRCTITVFVPNNGKATDTGGHPTKYHVLTDANNRDTKYGSFGVDQVNNRGRAVVVGTWPVTKGTIGVKMLDRGVDWNDDGATYAHHAVSQIMVTCYAK